MYKHQQNIKNEQLKLLLRNKTDLVAAEKSITRRDNAHYLVKELSKPHSIRFLVKTIERMTLYLDLDFVKEALMKFYFKTDNQTLKELIMSIHDGNFDDSSLLEEIEYQEELEKANQEAYLSLLRQRE